MDKNVKDTKNYNRGIFLAIFVMIAIAIALVILVNQKTELSPIFTIALSIEFGACVMLILSFFERRKVAAQRDEDHERNSIHRINEINDSLSKLTNELQELNEKIKMGIVKSRGDLATLQEQVTEFSIREQELKKQIKMWEDVKPESAKIITNEIKKGEKINIIYGFVLYLAGVFTPYVINFIFHI